MATDRMSYSGSGAARDGWSLNRIEQAISVVLYCYFVWRVWPAAFDFAHLPAVLIAASEGLVLALLLIRKPNGNISTRGSDWLIALVGTCAPLFVTPSGEPISVTAGMSLLLLGLLVHVGAKLCLLRSFGIVAADRGVKVHGVYRLIRHPMYAGYFLTHLGFLLFAPTIWNLGVYLIAWSVLSMRIAAEEAILLQNPVYGEYARRVRYRVVPGLY